MKIFWLTLSLLFFNATLANACDLNRIIFGSSTSAIIDQYKFEVLGVDTTGETILADHGPVLCKKYPEKSFVEFMFIDDQLVEVKITNPSSTQELLEFTLKSLGENDDKDRSKNKDGKISMALWNKDKQFAAIYTLAKGSDHDVELLNISSKNHKGLFEKIAKQRGQQIDAYLKQNKIGKYTPSTGISNNNDSSQATSTEDNGNGLKDMKQRFEKAQDKYKKDGKE